MSDVQFINGGTASYLTNPSAGTVLLGIPEIENVTSNTTSGSLRVELWAFSQPYSGGSQTGYVLATDQLSTQLGPNQYFNPFSVTVPLTGPPSGQYYTALLLTEYTGASSDNGYSVQDYIDFSNPYVTGGGGSTGGGANGPGGGGTGGGGTIVQNITVSFAYGDFATALANSALMSGGYCPADDRSSQYCYVVAQGDSQVAFLRGSNFQFSSDDTLSSGTINEIQVGPVALDGAQPATQGPSGLGAAQVTIIGLSLTISEALDILASGDTSALTGQETINIGAACQGTYYGDSGSVTFILDEPATGSHEIVGGAGDNTYEISFSRGQLNIEESGGVITVERAGTGLTFVDTLVNVQQLILAGQEFDTATMTFDPAVPAPGTGGPTIANTSGSQTTLTAPAANSTVQGGGYDVLDLSQNPIATASSAYTMTTNNNGTFTLATAGSSDLVSGVMQVEFSDKTVTVAANNSMNEYIALLYEGALGRTPDPSGLAYWEQIAAALPASTQALGVYGLSDASGNYNGALSVAGGFTNSAEFIAKYGSLTNAQFVTQLYANVLDRAPDTGGMNYWMSELSAGNSREHVLVGFADSAEAISNATVGYTGQSGAHAAWLFTV